MPTEYPLESRRQGSLRPDTVILITVDGEAMENAADFTYQIEASTPDALTTVLWTKTTGFTVDAAGVTIAWATGDMGALTASSKAYVLELTGTYQSKSFKVWLRQQITATVQAA